MIKVSSLTVAKNEERNIRRLIESLLPVMDEILILIDSATTDATEEIIKEYPRARHQRIDWMGYAKTKEYGLEQINNHWVLWIDADEELSPKLQKEIERFKASEHFPHAAYSIPRRANFIGRWINHGGWYPGRVIRLFHKPSVTWSDKEVHEHLIVHGSTGELHSDLNHYTDHSIEHYYDKFNLYTSLAAVDAVKQGKQCSLFDLLLRPAFLFFKMYFLRFGFLDGLAGFMLAVFSANYVFTKYAKIWERRKEQ